MTVASETMSVSYTGDGSTDTYAFSFKILDQAHLRVTQRDPAASPAQVVETLVVDTDYTVAGVGDPDGGTVTLTAGNLAADVVLKIERIVPLKQETDIRNEGSFYREAHENALDRLVMEVQAVKADQGVPTGAIMGWPTSLAPSPGYLLCNGDAVSRTEYAALFALIGTTFGVGDGSTTFNLPDLDDIATNVAYMIKT